MKRDLFLIARMKFVLFCGLICTALLCTIFGITYFVNARSVNNQIYGTLSYALVQAKDGVENDEFRGSCIVIRFGDPILFVNASGYEEEELLSIARSLRGKEGDFRKNGRQYSYLGTAQDGEGYLFAVYDSTAEAHYLRKSGTVLFFSFVSGLIAILLIAWLYSYYIIKPTKDALDKQRELVANASHELKTPLTIINANLSLLKGETAGTEEEKERYVSAMDAQISRMNSLILEMLDLCKMERGTPEIELYDVDASSVVDGCALCYEAGCYEKGVELLTEVEGGVTLRSNREALEKLTLILLDNALKYCAPRGWIKLSLRKKKKGAVLTVENAGEGLTPEQCKRIFDRFYKVDASRNSENSANSFGLGLSIAEAVVHQLNGTIGCSSAMGESVTFTVNFNE